MTWARLEPREEMRPPDKVWLSVRTLQSHGHDIVIATLVIPASIAAAADLDRQAGVSLFLGTGGDAGDLIVGTDGDDFPLRVLRDGALRIETSAIPGLCPGPRAECAFEALPVGLIVHLPPAVMGAHDEA